jgi:hypothetical protein
MTEKELNECIQKLEAAHKACLEMREIAREMDKIISREYEKEQIEDAKSLLDDQWWQHQDQHHDENEYLEK